MSLLTKSKKRVQDYGEVFTPAFIVNDMLDLVKQETERIESRFLEPACGDGNFLIEVLRRKLAIVKKNYKKSQFDYERNIIYAVMSIYGVDLLEDNVQYAQDRLFLYVESEYKTLYKKKANRQILDVVRHVLQKNILQGNALDLKNNDRVPIRFAEWSPVGATKIKRRDYVFEEIINPGKKKLGLFDAYLTSDTGQSVFIPEPVQEYPLSSFLTLPELDAT